MLSLQQLLFAVTTACMIPTTILKKELYSVGRLRMNNGAAIADIAPVAMEVHRMVLEALQDSSVEP